MVRVEIVFSEQAEGHLVEEGVTRMPITAARVRTTGAAETGMGIRILLAVQTHTERDQSTGVSPGIFIVIGHGGKVPGDDLPDVCGDPACLPARLAEAVKSQILLRLAE
jgi:hypothetical protein